MFRFDKEFCPFPPFIEFRLGRFFQIHFFNLLDFLGFLIFALRVKRLSVVFTGDTPKIIIIKYYSDGRRWELDMVACLFPSHSNTGTNAAVGFALRRKNTK